LSLADIRQEAMAQGIVARVSGTTLWRWLSADAIRPWQHRSWIFPRDPDFARKAGHILDLYDDGCGRFSAMNINPAKIVDLVRFLHRTDFSNSKTWGSPKMA
jgi:hypothetical protein